MFRLQRRYFVDGLHVSPRVVPRIVEALHEAGALEGSQRKTNQIP